MRNITENTIKELIGQQTFDLQSSHAKLCIPIINRIFKKMSSGIKFSGIKVADNLIIDGHHRYIASLFANITLERYPINSTLGSIAYSWEAIIFENEDWDTQVKIDMLNEQDAKFNNMPIDQIIQILK